MARVCTLHPAKQAQPDEIICEGCVERERAKKRGKEGNQYKAVLKVEEGHCHVALVTALEWCSSRSILEKWKGKWVPCSEP